VEQEWLTVAQIAEQLKLHVMTVYRLIHAGRLGAVKVGRSYRVEKSTFDKYLDEVRTSGNPRS
jgi:excisionase family DNA binding protein